MEKTQGNLNAVERREWHLWILALSLILVLSAITIGTYFFLIGETYNNFSLLRTLANRALIGLCILIMLFCAYIVTTRRTLSTMRATLEYQAIRDNLTDLYDRRYFNERLEEEISRASQYRYLLAILLCDIDNFKKINNTHGHQVGDAVLKSVAQTIRESTRGADLVARWGGDEIVVALANSTREGVLIATERIRSSMQKIGETHHLLVDMSIGVALYPEHHTDSDELLRHAERALYIAKKGGTKIQIGEEEYKIDKHAMKIVFQPIIDTRLNRIFAYEALGRDPQGKLGILELFKRYQTIGKLNELKCLGFELELEKAKEAGLQKMFVNMDFEMLRSLEHVSKPDGIDIILEISEKEVLDNIEGRLRTAQKWRDKGFKFAIDDFGAGFISLPFIAQLIPDYIKIDRSTILQAVSSRQFREFLKDMMLAIKNYSAEGIIAEGIETEQELSVVKELGLDLVQGFLLGRPHELTSSSYTALSSVSNV